MKILLLESYYTGSHKQWADQIVSRSVHEVTLWTMPGKYWKWRMHGAAIHFADRYKEEAPAVDLIIASDMMDVAVFRGLVAAEVSDVQIAVYMHENQLTYPWGVDRSQIDRERDRHYGFINYTSILAADQVYFNSDFHRTAFFSELRTYLKALPDYRGLDHVSVLQAKSSVWYPMIDLDAIDAARPDEVNEKNVPVVVWNHRWEHDKRPEVFFQTLFELDEAGVEFFLIVLGESYAQVPDIFAKARAKLADRILHWGYAASLEEYYELLWRGDILPVTSVQENFGISVLESAFAQMVPLLPNRLVYPEHFGDLPDLLYDDEEFYEKLRDLLQSDLSLLKSRCRKIASKYGYEEIVIRR